MMPMPPPERVSPPASRATGESSARPTNRSSTGLPTEGAFLARLETVIHAAWQRPFYRQHWQDHGIAGLDQAIALLRRGALHRLPVIRKADLREHLDDIVDFTGAGDVFSSSGTTGRPVDIPILHAEEPVRVAGIRRVLRELGVSSTSRVLQLLSLNDLFALGPLAWQAAKAEGACVFRCTAQRAGRVRQVIEHHRPGFVIGNPFALARLAEESASWWPDRAILPDRAFLAVAATFDGELVPTPVTRRVVELWGLESWLNHYGSSELGPVAYECRQHRGLHVHDDMHHVELIDPQSGAAIRDPDQAGELVVTGLSLPRGFVPVRYATGDMMAWLRRDPCPCGRSSPRLGPVVGRLGSHLELMGQTVFPELLVDIADGCPEVLRSAVVVRRGPLGEDAITVLLVPSSDPGGRDDSAIRGAVRAAMAAKLAIVPGLDVVAASRLAELETQASKHSNLVKIPRFFDLRDGQDRT